MDISLIIPTHRRINGVMTLLQSLSKQRLDSLSIEVIVVSNLHDEELETAITQSQKANFTILYTFTGSIGVNQARNKGLDCAKSDLILFLDDDVVVSDHTYLASIHKYAQRYPNAAAIGGRYILPEKSNISDKAYFNISNSWLTHGKSEDSLAVHLVGGNTLYNRKVLKHLLKFNENISFGGAETELNLRIYQAGHRLMLFEDIGLEHFTRLTPKKFFRKAFFQGMGRAYHELIVHPSIWKSPELAEVPERTPLSGSMIEIQGQKLLIEWFDLFFKVGYRHAKQSDFSPVKWWFFIKCFLIELFHLDVDDRIFEENNYSDKSFFSFLGSKIRFLFRFLSGIITRFFKHKVFSHSWLVPWFLKYRVVHFFTSRMWIIPWFFKAKLFSKAWIIPWFLKWRLFTFYTGRIVPAFKKSAWFFRWRIIPLFLVWRKIPWWKFPWFLRYKFFVPLTGFIKKHAWRIPAFFKYQVFSHAWRIPWFFKWRLLPGIIFLSVFSVSMFFPVSLVGLGTIYVAVWEDLERFIKKPWSQD